MKKLSLFLFSFSTLFLFYSCSTTQDVVVTPNFIATNDLPLKPIFSSSLNNDYFQEEELFSTQNPYSLKDSSSTISRTKSPFDSFRTSTYGLNEYVNWHNPYSMRVRQSGYYGNQYYSSYAHGFYWGIHSPGFQYMFFPLPSATFLNYQFTSSFGYNDRIRYQDMRKTQFCRTTPDETTNTYITYHLKNSNTYNYNTKQRTKTSQGAYHYPSSAPQEIYYPTQTTGGSNNTGGGQTRNNRTGATYSPAPVRIYSPRTSGGGSRNSGSPSRQPVPKPSTIPTATPRKF